MSESTLRVGVIGVGKRGLDHVAALASMSNVEVTAVCDVYEDRVEHAAEVAGERQAHRPAQCLDYRRVLDRGDVDAVVIASSWTSHTPIALDAMRAGKYTASEVGGAASLEECWQLVRVQEATGTPIMMLENVNYGRTEMALLNMVRRGLFGELVHCGCGYQHDIRDEIATGYEQRHYRLDNYRNRNGDVYPTHGLGPIAKILNLNRGNRMLTLTSMASKARGLREWAQANLGADHPAASYAYTQGDIVNTLIKCAHGETILITHDTSLPRPPSRNGRIQGTKGLWMEDIDSVHFDRVSQYEEWEPFEGYRDEYEHPLWREYLAKGVQGGHGGMDWLVLSAFVDSALQGTPPPLDVYDMALWMSITPLSEQSVALGSQPVVVPDFTGGRWLDGSLPAALGKYALDVVDEAAFAS